ncbi:MAG: MFS transporter [Bacteroidales bacterium]|nr:MFS transporter [Bacteroidales bacterium]
MTAQKEKTTALVVATLASFLTPFLGAAMNVALPVIGKDLEVDAILLNLTATIYLLATAVFLLPFGRMADLYGRKKIFNYGLIVFTISTAGAAIAPGIYVLILFRVFQGIGSAMIFGTGVAIISSVFPPGERGKALGINVAAVYTGLSVGPFAGGLLTQYLGWRSIFWSLVPIGILAIIMVHWKLRGEWLGSSKARFDYRGALLYMLTLTLLMTGLSLVPKPAGYPFIAFSIISFVLFVRTERRLEDPLIKIDLYRLNRVFAFSNLAALINYSATFGVGFLLSFYFQYIKGMDPAQAGMVLVIQPVIMAVFSPVTGRLSDRIQPQVLASAGMAFTTVGLVMLSFAGAQTSMEYFYAVLGLMGIGFALFSSPNTNAIMSSVQPRYYGVASGAVGTMRMIGQMLSMGVVLILFSVLIGKTEITPRVHEPFLQSMRISFIFFSVFCFLGIFASIARGKVR